MSPREHEFAETPVSAGAEATRPAKGPAGRCRNPSPSSHRQFYIFLIAADVVVLFIYLFLVPKDTWENYNGRLRSLGSSIVSVLAYLGLSSLLQRYVTKFTFLDQIWFRAQINLLFYRWLAELLEGNCDAAQNSLHEFTDYLGRSEVNGYQNGWTFKATRDYVDSLASRGALDPDSHALVESAMELLESTPMDSVKAKAFLAKVAVSKHPPCPTHAWLSEPHVAFRQ